MARRGHGGKGGERAAAGSRGEVQVTCPCCKSRLLVDSASGVVLREDRPKKPGKSFETMLDEERSRRRASDELFGQALQSQKDQQDLLDRKFQEALKKAADDPDRKPPSPFDGD